eukprot:SAG25_NODE_8089_length_440_cov_3.193548_1_plen_76_part_01
MHMCRISTGVAINIYPIAAVVVGTCWHGLPVLTGDPLRAPQRGMLRAPQRGMLVPLLFLPLYYVLPLGGSVAPGRF